MCGHEENRDTEMLEEQCNNATKEYGARCNSFEGENDSTRQSSNDGEKDIDSGDTGESYHKLRQKDETVGISEDENKIGDNCKDPVDCLSDNCFSDS